MPDPIGPRPAATTVLDDLAAVPANLSQNAARAMRPKIKAQAHAKLAPFSFSSGDVQVTIKALIADPADCPNTMDASDVRLVQADHLFVDLDVTVAGKKLAPPLVPFSFHNIPVLVPDPAGTIERTRKDRRTGKTVTATYRLDVQAALKAAILDKIRILRKMR